MDVAGLAIQPADQFNHLALGPAAIALGEAEGLDAHARSVAIRINPR